MSERNTKLVLDMDEMTESFYADSVVLGIMTSLKDYRFCWQVNQLTLQNFKANNDLEIRRRRKGRDYVFTIYEHYDSSKNISHFLYNNQNDGEYLLSELKHLDFIWLMKGDGVCPQAKEETIQYIREINSVQLVLELAYDKIKNKEFLLL